jgi:peptidoglycan/xylan/chitin deacetylase (PgdA/CDA1 family)
MRIPGVGRLRRYAARIRRQVTGSALILLYHRVAEISADPQLLCVTPKNFSEQMRVLRQFGEPLALSELVTRGRNRDLPRRGIVITFDDGYADNLHNAKPILDYFKVPATVFVAAGHVGDDREYWWDELERILLQPRRLPETLTLQVDGAQREWRLGKSSTYTEEDWRVHRGWNVRESAPTERHRLYLALHRLVRPLPVGKRDQVLEDLRSWAGCPVGSRATHRPLDASELHTLASGGLVDVGAHTVNHPVLAAVPVDVQAKEIAQSRHLLEQMLKRRVISFAYPFGGVSDYASDSVMAVRNAGFESACSNYPGLVDQRSDWFQLPRFLSGDWNAEEFSSRLVKFLAHA